MIKHVLACAGGVVVGAALCYGGYRMYKYYKESNIEKSNSEEKDIFAEKLKQKEAQTKRYNELVASQTYVELLKVTELISWFKANKEKVDKNAKMFIIIPTSEHMRGLGYPSDHDLDIETNIVQLFYDEDEGRALLIRLVNFTDIDSNLQATLLEQDGMMVITE